MALTVRAALFSTGHILPDGQSMKHVNDAADPSGGDKLGTFEQVFAAPAAQVTQNFNDLTNDFFESHHMEVPTKIVASKPATEAPIVTDFKVPERKANPFDAFWVNTTGS